MKISKSKLRQIIKEELAEARETALNSPSEAGRQWEFSNYLLKMYQDLSETGDVATIREIIQDNFNSALRSRRECVLRRWRRPKSHGQARPGRRAALDRSRG